MGCGNFNVSSDKIVFESGSKYLTYLLGSVDKVLILEGNSNKNISLIGQKQIPLLTGDKFLDILIGTKIITDLIGTKLNLINLGSKDKITQLLSNGSCNGWWYITVDSTYYTVDNVLITIDRNTI